MKIYNKLPDNTLEVVTSVSTETIQVFNKDTLLQQLEGIQKHLDYYQNEFDSLTELILKCNELDINVTNLGNSKTKKLAELEKAAKQAEIDGYFDSDLNITIAIEKEDIQQFNNLLALNNLAEKMGIPIPDMIITDINHNPQVISWMNFQILLIKMGGYLKSIWDNLATKKSLVHNAETIEEVELVNWVDDVVPEEESDEEIIP